MFVFCFFEKNFGFSIYKIPYFYINVNIKTAKSFKLVVKGSLGFDYAQVTKGGINTFDIDENSMESKLVKGIYVIGEMLDVDGDSGGYNLQWAFSSAKLATDSILKEL